MEEVNKKKIIKSHSYNENFPFTQKDIIFLKPETEESKLNRSILIIKYIGIVPISIYDFIFQKNLKFK